MGQGVLYLQVFVVWAWALGLPSGGEGVAFQHSFGASVAPPPDESGLDFPPPRRGERRPCHIHILYEPQSHL